MGNNSYRVFFDFCETLIRFQTADRFVDYCRERLHDKRMNRLHKITSIATKICLFKLLSIIFPGNNLHKRAVLLQLKGTDRSTLECLGKKYFENELKPAIIQPIMTIMKRHIAQGDEVWIVSGGYDIYIKYFVSYYGLSGYIASNITFDTNGVCLGRIANDCMGKRKVRLLRRYLGGIWNSGHTIAYTDSRSDLPLLSRVSSGVVVSYKRHKPWTGKYNFKEIIWE